MPPYEILIPFFVASAIFACIPGPGMLYAAAQTIARGRRAGLLSALGFFIGSYVHLSAAAFGLAVLLETVPLLYGILKFGGAAYLIWLGVNLFMSGKPVPSSAPETRPPPQHRVFRDSIIVEVLNPKTALFYLAFLPQFTVEGAQYPYWAQVLILGTVVNLMFAVTDAACILISGKTTTLLAASSSATRLAHRFGGGVLVVLGAKLALSRQ